MKKIYEHKDEETKTITYEYEVTVNGCDLEIDVYKEGIEFYFLVHGNGMCNGDEKTYYTLTDAKKAALQFAKEGTK